MKKLILLCAVCFTISCSNENPGDAIQSLSWLEGRWVNNSNPLSPSSENWTIISPLLYSGTGITLSGNDTLFFENLKILQEDGYLLYIADVGEGPVRFKLTSRSENRWVFSNPEHDFPKKIIYTRSLSENEEWLIASTEGNGKQVDFRFKKASE